MGTPLPHDYRKPDGTPYLSGTEWEYLDALAAAEQGSTPVVLVYRRTEKCLLDQDDPEYEEKRTQYQRVKTFFAAFIYAGGDIKTRYIDSMLRYLEVRRIGLHRRLP